MNAKISPNLISFVCIRRGDWLIKISVYKKKDVLVVAQHIFDTEKMVIKQFTHQDEAADFINMIVEKDE
jgi:hypothetical protein